MAGVEGEVEGSDYGFPLLEIIGGERGLGLEFEGLGGDDVAGGAGGEDDGLGGRHFGGWLDSFGKGK